jgi:O-antigen/teichoic acid export membrane protein
MSNTARIAKNTLALYFRQILIMLVSLYTVRVVLNTLGAEDYGIYNVVGGVVAMLGFLSGTMASASQRFFAYELGQNNIKHLQELFSLTLFVYIGIALFILVLGECVGVWFINSKLTIPESRMDAANWVFQCSLLSFMVTIVSIPYQAVIIAREAMSIYAFVSLGESLIKLLIVYLLPIIMFDKLKIYAVLMCCIAFFTTTFYYLYCRKKFKESVYHFYWNSKELKEIISFAWWNMIGAIAGILRNQGVNVLLNIFFNPAVNAARAVAYQINSALSTFSNNFYIAVKPQIVKYYSNDELNKMNNLVIKSSKLSFYLIMLLSIPFLLETEYVLRLWLKVIPDYTIIFTRLIIINTLIDIFNAPLGSVMQATGKIKAYQLIVGISLLMNFPIAYIFLLLGYSPEITMIISIAISILCITPRLYFVRKHAKISLRIYFFNVFCIAAGIFLLSSIVPTVIFLMIGSSIYRLLLIVLSDLIISSGIIYTIGLTKDERMVIRVLVKRVIPI